MVKVTMISFILFISGAEYPLADFVDPPSM